MERELGGQELKGFDLPVAHLMNILTMASAYDGKERHGLITQTLAAILRSSSLHRESWLSFSQHPDAADVLKSVILAEPVQKIREECRLLVERTMMRTDSVS